MYNKLTFARSMKTLAIFWAVFSLTMILHGITNADFVFYGPTVGLPEYALVAYGWVAIGLGSGIAGRPEVVPA